MCLIVNSVCNATQHCKDLYNISSFGEGTGSVLVSTANSFVTKALLTNLKIEQQKNI